MASFQVGKQHSKRKRPTHRALDEMMCRKRGTRNTKSEPAPRIKSQFLIPTKYATNFMFAFLTQVRNNYDTDSYENCRKYLEKINSEDEYPMTLNIPYSGSYTPFSRDKLTIQIIQRCLILNQRFRWAMKRLIYRWRLSKLKAINEEDIFTGEIPKKLVVIYDWPQKTKYAFEASTVYRDYMTKIQNATGLFVAPKMPRNPFTNSELTYGQLHFIIRALIQYGFNHWSFDAIKKCGYSMDTFQDVYAYPLKYDNLKSVFKKPTEIDCVDIVYDFIGDEYYHHDVEQPYKYGWDIALREHPDLPIIQEWRSLALQQQQLVIRYDADMLQIKLKPIHEKSLKLITKSVSDIRRIYTKWLLTKNKNTVMSNHNNYVIENIIFPNHVLSYIESPLEHTYLMDIEISDGSDSP